MLMGISEKIQLPKRCKTSLSSRTWFRVPWGPEAYSSISRFPHVLRYTVAYREFLVTPGFIIHLEYLVEVPDGLARIARP
jgi:hypothetical protein